MHFFANFGHKWKSSLLWRIYHFSTLYAMCCDSAALSEMRFWFEEVDSLLARVWTGGQWVQWETRPMHVQGNPLHLRKFPLHLQTCLKVGFNTSPAIIKFQKDFWNVFKFFKGFLARFKKNTKYKIFCLKRLQTMAQNVHECKC